ncbi:CHAT domain-containing protein [Nocardia jiangxiensis]|uniref:CHAT domain-containing protein n=1 Tax=Nocardia jiangxiensis TaxID=282685 RepID=A0ABW6SDT3_9NOCA
MTELHVSVHGALTDLTLTCNYQLRSSTAAGAGSLQQEYVVEPSPDLVSRSCEELDRIVTEAVGPARTDAGANGADPTARLIQIGSLLYNALFPSADGSIPELVRRLREAEGPLLVRTNESTIPWELLHDGEDFLAMGRDIGRHPHVTKRVVAGRPLNAIARALVIGDPLGDLPAARAEAERISSWLRARDVECTTLIGEQADTLGVHSELATGTYDLLHYCGHVVMAEGTPYAGLYLHGKDLFDQRSMANLDAHGAPPVVFVNGCASADRLANLCVPFMVKGAKIVVGTRHPVGDVPSREFAEHFYTELIGGATAGGAVRSARRALRDTDKIEWASFVLYGDPATRVAVGEPPSATPPRPPSEVDGYRMDGEARAVIDRMVRSAGPAGFATSLELFLELMATNVVQGRITAVVGAEQLTVATFATNLLRTFQGAMPAGDGDSDGIVKVSDTVTTVLVRAERAAQAAGRDTITVADLIDEFVAVGGGSSGPLLAMMGIPLHGLSRPGAAPSVPPPSIPQPAPARRDPVIADALFDDAGDIRADRMDPDVARAIRTAGMLGSLSGNQISSGLLLYGFAAVGGALYDALELQDDAGKAAIESLTPARRTRQNRFSPRLRKTLLAALENGQRLDESAVLRQMLSEPSSAREILTRAGVDITRLLADL